MTRCPECRAPFDRATLGAAADVVVDENWALAVTETPIEEVRQMAATLWPEEDPGDNAGIYAEGDPAGSIDRALNLGLDLDTIYLDAGPRVRDYLMALLSGSA